MRSNEATNVQHYHVAWETYRTYSQVPAAFEHYPSRHVLQNGMLVAIQTGNQKNVPQAEINGFFKLLLQRRNLIKAFLFQVPFCYEVEMKVSLGTPCSETAQLGPLQCLTFTFWGLIIE